MIIRIILFLLLFTGTVFSQAERSGASYKIGTGIFLSDETRASIGLEMIGIKEMDIRGEIDFIVQVYREADESGYALSRALIPAEQADLLQIGGDVSASAPLSITGKIVRLDHTMKSFTRRVEVMVELPDPDNRFKTGAFISMKAAGSRSNKVAAIPSSAVLQSAFGEFAFVQNGDAILRTPITTGARQGDYVEIVDGLFSGDEVAADMVQTLYLIELRATKGGGHCH